MKIKIFLALFFTIAMIPITVQAASPDFSLSATAVYLTDANTSQNITTSGSATGDVEITAALPSGFQIQWLDLGGFGFIVVEASRPTAPGAYINEAINATATREGVSADFTINVNLSSTARPWTATIEGETTPFADGMAAIVGNPDSRVTLTVPENPGYLLTDITLGGVGRVFNSLDLTNRTIQFDMPNDFAVVPTQLNVTVYPTWQRLPREWTADVSGIGTITPAGGSVVPGSPVIITLDARAGYDFGAIDVIGVADYFVDTAAGTVAFDMPFDPSMSTLGITLSPTWTAISRTWNATLSGEGILTISTGAATAGTAVTITINERDGYNLTALSLTGAVQGAVDLATRSISFTMPTWADSPLAVTVNATWESIAVVPELIGTRNVFVPEEGANVIFHMSESGETGALSAYNDTTISTAAGGYVVTTAVPNNWSGVRLNVGDMGAEVGDTIQLKGRTSHHMEWYMYWGYVGPGGNVFGTSPMDEFIFARELDSTDDIIIAANLWDSGFADFFFSIDDVLIVRPESVVPDRCLICNNTDCTCQPIQQPPPPTPSPPPSPSPPPRPPGGGASIDAPSSPGLPSLTPSPRSANPRQPTQSVTQSASPAQPTPPAATANDTRPDESAPGENGGNGGNIKHRLQVQIGSSMVIDLADNAPVQTMDVAPIIVDGRTLVPVRFIAYAFGARVDWNESAREVTLTLNEKNLTFAIGETAPGMDVPAKIIDNRTMVPLRFISEFFGAEVSWCENTSTIEILMMK